MSLRSEQRLVSTSLPTHGQLTLMFAIVVVLIVVLGATAPLASHPTSGTEGFLSAYAGAVCVIEITTAILLLATFRVQRSIGLLFLSFGYLLSGALLPPWALTFPGIFDVVGSNENLQATAWIAAIRRIGFALAVLGFAVGNPERKAASPRRWMAWSLAAVTACLAASLWIALHKADGLPSLMADERVPAGGWDYVPPTTIALYVLGILLLLRRRHSALDIWMAVVLFSLLGEILLLSYWAEGVRLSVGWWSGRIIGLVAAAIILVVLLAETAGNYVRLAEAAALDLRSRRNRMTAMEALSASIAHEINQPLSSIVTNADAGLRWLKRENPDMAQAAAALSRIVEDGHRAGKVVSGIRTMFLKGVQERAAVDVRRVIDDAVSHCQSESVRPIDIRRVYPAEGIEVNCNALQILQVCINLIENAADGRDGAREADRCLTISVRRREPGEVEIAFADNGPGVPAALSDRVFEPFFSTKTDGMGMGLMFCRSVAEAHGGRLWLSSNQPRGAIFHLTLPAPNSATAVSGRQADD
ncbi:MAG: MASE4 domain-containing protein [Aurantimonas endophytica]|uniref:MASE4 domain-containing protein n=1 Tax=Aurantimonas endophytica TaxID=1522175 RepID=UPI003001FD3D